MILKNRYSQICRSWRKCAFFEEKNKQQNKTNERKSFDILIYFRWLLCYLHLKNFSMGSCKFSWSQFIEFKHNEKYKNGGFGRTSRSWFHVFFWNELLKCISCTEIYFNPKNRHNNFDLWTIWVHFRDSQTGTPVSKIFWLRPWKNISVVENTIFYSRAALWLIHISLCHGISRDPLKMQGYIILQNCLVVAMVSPFYNLNLKLRKASLK